MATVPHPSKTLLAVLAIGLLCGTPIVLADSPQQDGHAYQATAFDPETEADVLAHRSSDVTNLTHYAETNRTRRLLQRAADGETVTFAEDDSELASLANENNHTVYRGAYYRLHATERNETVTLRLEPSSADAVMRDLAVEYDLGFGEFPVCMSKTFHSLSDDASKKGAPTGWELEISEVYPSAGAELLVALTADALTMPGLPRRPAAADMDIDDDGNISGLF
jgi:hypothetical protein